MKLVIAEKPSVGAAIAAVLGANEKRRGYFEGGGYLVPWCIGHLISLADAATYNEQYRKWKYDDLPIVPQDWQFTVANGKEQQFSVLKDLMHRSDVSEIVNACDSGREGELIFRFVYEQANCKKPFSRLWISSMEESAIREGFSNLKDGRSYDNLYQSALCRAKADWLVGINATRLFSILYHKTLNVGRVQTPTLTMLVNRDYAISSFKKEKYHVVRLDAGGVSALSERLNDEAAAQQMKAACEKSQAVCTSLKKEKKTVAPPKLFDLTALQREANRLYGFTAKQTLDHVSSATTLDIYSHITDTMQRQAAVHIDRKIGGTDAQMPTAEPSAGQDTVPIEFTPYKPKIRKPGTGCVTMINDHLYEGRYTPTNAYGKRESHNIYAKTREECEEKLAEMIAEVKAQIKAEKEKMTG